MHVLGVLPRPLAQMLNTQHHLLVLESPEPPILCVTRVQRMPDLFRRSVQKMCLAGTRPRLDCDFGSSNNVYVFQEQVGATKTNLENILSAGIILLLPTYIKIKTTKTTNTSTQKHLRGSSVKSLWGNGAHQKHNLDLLFCKHR